MATQPPPPRYRVVEQGRRLVVIDTLTGEAATRSHAAPAAARPALSAVPEKLAFDGRSTIVTRAFYDDKAPRTLTLDRGATGRLETLRGGGIGIAVAAVFLLVFMPWLLVFAIVPVMMVLNGRTRAGLRAAVTRWLDRYDTGSSTG